MKMLRAIVCVVVIVAALWHASDGQPQRPLAEQLRLAGAMPRGALCYVQARDLSALMKAWTASTVRNKFYASPSYTAFSKSRVFLKFQDRRADFEKVLGFGIDEDRLTEIAGGASAVAVYDIGKLDMVFVTELTREKALLTTMFKQLAQFQERNSDSGIYYAKDVQTDGGRLSQQFCFAHAGGKLIVTTSEGLMIRALAAVKNNGAESLLGDVMAIADQAKGFATHDLTMWLDQARLNRDRLFNSYWIHHNAGRELNGIESGLLDLRITAQSLTEQRYFKMGTGSRGAVEVNEASLKGSDVAALLKFAPADAQLAEVHPQARAEALADTVANALFGQLPTAEPVRPDVASHSSSSSDDESGGRVERYSRLDARFDVDVDDEQAPARGSSSTARKAKVDQSTRAVQASLVAAITKLAPVAVCELTRSKTDADRPFVHFERAVVIEMKSESALDRAALERAIVEEMRARFVVAGVDPRFNWQDDAGVRVLGQSLLEQGAAYVVAGKYLVLASSKPFAADIAQAAAATAEAARIDGNVGFYALVRIRDAKPVFDKLMAKLDGKVAAPPAVKAKQGDQEEDSEDDSTTEIKFFSDNVSSLVAATTIRDVRLRRESSGALVSERLVYSF